MENRYMMNYIIGCMKQTLTPRIFFVIIGIIFCICLDTWNQIPFLWIGNDSSIDVRYYWFNSYGFGGIYSPTFMPMLVVSIYATSYCKENISKNDQFIIGRMGCRRYAFSKAIVNAVISGITVCVSGILFILFASLFKPLYNANRDMEAMGFPYFKYLKTGNSIPYFIIVLYLAVLMGVLWSSVSLMMSTFITNHFIVIATPFLLSFIMSRIYVIFQTPTQFRLDNWFAGLSGYHSDEITLLLCTLTVFIIFTISSIIFSRQIERRNLNVN